MNISKKNLFYLSIPVFFSNSAVPLVGLVDTGLMGNLEESKFLAATSVATAVMTMIVWSFAFLRMGTVGIVSELYGKSDYREIARTLLRNIMIIRNIGMQIHIKRKSTRRRILNTIEEQVRTTKRKKGPLAPSPTPNDLGT